MDTISVLIGFLIGVVATMIAVEFGLKKIFRPPALNKITGAWRLDDHASPLVVAQDASGVPFPQGARVVTAGAAAGASVGGKDLRRNPNARSNFLVDRELDRALVFMGPIREGTLALATLDPAVTARLRAEHRRLWETGSPYVADVPLPEVAQKTGMLVRVRGRVQECVAYREHHLLRVTDGKDVVGAVVEEPLRLDGQPVVITGRVVRGASGYPLLEAEEVRLERGSKEVAATRTRQRQMDKETGADSAPATAPTATPTPAHSGSGPRQRVLRVPGNPMPADEEPVEPSEQEPDPVMEFEEAEPVVTEAERRRQRARVTLHR